MKLSRVIVALTIAVTACTVAAFVKDVSVVKGIHYTDAELQTCRDATGGCFVWTNGQRDAYAMLYYKMGHQDGRSGR